MPCSGRSPAARRRAQRARKGRPPARRGARSSSGRWASPQEPDAAGRAGTRDASSGGSRAGPGRVRGRRPGAHAPHCPAPRRLPSAASSGTPLDSRSCASEREKLRLRGPPPPSAPSGPGRRLPPWLPLCGPRIARQCSAGSDVFGAAGAILGEAGRRAQSRASVAIPRRHDVIWARRSRKRRGGRPHRPAPCVWRRNRGSDARVSWLACTGLVPAFSIMGLCKCPKRKVTNLFCFEHRVNVCENCIVANHAKCIVQSYLQWLQDSDYNPNCRLCKTLLSTKETVRLVCYDLFHWSCLNEMANQLPKNTAPAGYQCPSCLGPVFPPANLVSPVASVLREKLSTVNWARAGLGLPLVDEMEMVQEMDSHDTTDYTDWSGFTHLDAEEAAQQNSLSTFAYSSSSSLTSSQQQQQSLNNMGVPEQHTVITVNALGGDPVTINAASSPRKVYDTREGGGGRAPETRVDFDEDKYRRRPALSWLAQLLKNRFSARKQPRSLMQRFLILLLIGGIGFLTLIIVMMKLGRASADNDPNLDPMFNPHIRVGQE